MGGRQPPHGLACDVQSLCAALGLVEYSGAFAVRAVAAAQATTVLPRFGAGVFSPLPPRKAPTGSVHCKCSCAFQVVAEDRFKWCYESDRVG